jgi:hypothetical protein
MTEQQVAFGQVGDQVCVGVPEELPTDQRDVVGEVAVRLDRVHHRESVCLADSHVVGTEGRGLVNQTGAVLGRDVVGENHEMRFAREFHQFERPLVVPALHLGAGD